MNSKMLAAEKDNKKLKVALRQAEDMLAPDQIASYHEKQNSKSSQAAPSKTYSSFENAGGE